MWRKWFSDRGQPMLNSRQFCLDLLPLFCSLPTMPNHAADSSHSWQRGSLEQQIGPLLGRMLPWLRHRGITNTGLGPSCAHRHRKWALGTLGTAHITKGYTDLEPKQVTGSNWCIYTVQVCKGSDTRCTYHYIHGLTQDCSNSTAKAFQFPQS